ncbi:MAG: exodeoxyribonuclease I [Wenzhouxiangella sp.]
MSDSFLWHDYETFGADPRRDRPAQFAAIRTDSELRPVADPMVLYCKPSADLLPQPAACLITGITPQMAAEHGVPEPEFAAAVFEAMAVPGTCTVGYNNFRFDDEFSRHLFWRNFFDPYTREFANGNSRFDLIDLARMTRALRPTGLNWPDREDGLPSFRLEHLAAANGMDTSRAHDALADVEATLGLARLIRQAQPRLWEWALGLRQRHVVDRLLRSGRPLLHSSSRLPAQWCATAAVLPIAEHPQFRGQWVVWNLREDPDAFLNLHDDLLADLLWTPAADLPEDQQRLPVKLIRANRCPMISPMAVLDGPAARRLAIDLDAVERHAARLIAAPEWCARVASLFQRPETSTAVDAELDLYGGFVARSDHAMRERIRQLDGQALADLASPFSDERLNVLLFRYRARHWPASLSDQERAAWDDYRRRRLIDDPELASIRLDEFCAELMRLRSQHPQHQALFQALADWLRQIDLSDATTEYQ